MGRPLIWADGILICAASLQVTEYGLRPFGRFVRSNDVQLRFAIAERKDGKTGISLIQDAKK